MYDQDCPELQVSEKNTNQKEIYGMDNKPKISVIIPIYNQEMYLYECLETVLLQNIQDIEVICVNDGSTDKSFEILSELAWTDERLRIINQENKGVGEARNAGIREAKGEYLAFIDPDDKYYNFKALENLYNKAKENNALVCGGCFTIQFEGKGEKDIFRGSEARYVFSEDRFYTYQEYQYDYGFHRFIYDRKLILENNLFFKPLKRFQDPVWFVQVLHKAGKFFGVSEKIYSYRSGHKENIFDKEKVCHIVQGITEVARFSMENKYDHLLNLEKLRITRRYSEDIYNYICDEDEDMQKLIKDFEDATGFKNIERVILSNVLKKRDKQLEELDDAFEKKSEEADKYRLENGALKRAVDADQAELKAINENLDGVLKELSMKKITSEDNKKSNVLPYPYFGKSFEKDGIKWTDLGDGRIEATGKAENDTEFVLTPPAKKTEFKTLNKKYRVSVGAPNVSRFTWFISGRVVEHKGDDPKARMLRNVTINETDGFAETFEIDTSGYDYFGKLYLKIIKGRTLDHVIFKPEICPID